MSNFEMTHDEIAAEIEKAQAVLARALSRREVSPMAKAFVIQWIPTAKADLDDLPRAN